MGVIGLCCVSNDVRHVDEVLARAVDFLAGRRIGAHLRQALEAGRLCSNDPVCADHQADDTNERRFQHGAAA